MPARPSIDERMNAWLNDQADAEGIPDADRQRFIDAMRGTTLAARLRMTLAVDELLEHSGLRTLLWRAVVLLARIGGRR